MTQNCTVASAPGKVLLTGGYLVLERDFSGLVVGTTARFYTVIRPSIVNKAGENIIVHSPQFENATWMYKAVTEDDDHLSFEPITTDSRNKFVETCLEFTLKVILAKTSAKNLNQLLGENGIEITIAGDNDFYSQRAQLKSNNATDLASLDPFCKTHATLSTVHKTGLGSSAALTTSLVTALLIYFKVIDQDMTQKSLVHNAAQFIHCFAQGKVGSGFDVSSAVWGSHSYKRFSPSVLTSIMDSKDINPKDLSKALDAGNKCWDNEVVPFALPPGFDLMLADIDAGSHTPTLVRDVLEWKKTKPEEANSLWKELGTLNSKVEQHLRKLSTLHDAQTELYNKTVQEFSNLTSSEWHSDNNVAKEVVELVRDFDSVRELLRKMSRLSNVCIEPEEQTRLLNECTSVPGVVMAGVPGAGGYDAIFCIVLSDTAKKNVYKIWESWKELSVGPLLSEADSNGVTSVGIESVPGLSKILSN